MRPVLQDVLDEVAKLEPKGRWTTSVVYWQDDTMQIRRFELERGPLFPILVTGWLKRLQARFVRSAMMTNEELSSQPLSLEEWVALGELVTNPPPVPDWVRKAVRGEDP